MRNEKYYIARSRDNNQNSLKHWKYVKKKRVNGKWRYYYDIKDALGFDEREAYRKAENEAANAEWRYNSAKKAEDAQAEYEADLRSRAYTKDFVDDVVGDAELDPKDPDYEAKKGMRTNYRSLGQAEGFIGTGFPDTAHQESLNLRAAEARKRYTQYKYSKTPLYKLEKAIDRGKKWFKKIFG